MIELESEAFHQNCDNTGEAKWWKIHTCVKRNLINVDIIFLYGISYSSNKISMVTIDTSNNNSNWQRLSRLTVFLVSVSRVWRLAGSCFTSCSFYHFVLPLI